MNKDTFSEKLPEVVKKQYNYLIDNIYTDKFNDFIRMETKLYEKEDRKKEVFRQMDAIEETLRSENGIVILALSFSLLKFLREAGYVNLIISRS